MSAIVVLMCMTANADRSLALRAVSSTAAGLRDGDIIFLHVDGALVCDEKTFYEAAAPIPIRFFYSSARRGLAAGLNKLIEAALIEEQWEYFARMDADDECLPGRFENQRNFFAANGDIDILGGLSREVDERGRHLRTKQLPSDHDSIVAHMPRRNPLNHPTIMLRRKVFEHGLRYKADVGLVEDWNLWIDAAAAGFRFANLREEVLIFRRGNDFFRKRGGMKQALAEWRVRRHAMIALGKQSAANFCYAGLATSLRFFPAPIQSLAYRVFC